MPCAGAQVLACLVRFKSRQVIFLTSRKAVLNIHLLLQSQEVSKAKRYQAEVGGLVAASAVNRKLQKLELILNALDRAEGELRNRDAERRFLVAALS